MIILLKKNADSGQVENLKSLLRSRGVEPHESVGSLQTVIGCVGDVAHINTRGDRPLWEGRNHEFHESHE